MKIDVMVAFRNQPTKRSHQMLQPNQDLKSLSNEMLVTRIRSLVAEERKITLQVLILINEAGKRRLHAELGYPSAFEWLVKDLGYSESSAMRRLNSARRLSEDPAIAPKIESGELNITNLAKAQSVIRAEEKRTGEKLCAAAKSEIVGLVESKSSREAEVALVNHYPEAMKMNARLESIRPSGSGEFQVQVTLNQKQIEKLTRIRELASHSNFGATLADLIEVIADEFLKRKDPLQREVRPRPTSVLGSESENVTQCATGAGNENENRVRKPIKPSIRNLVFKRALGMCEYVDEQSGRRCGSRYLAEIDHIMPVARGGSNALENLRTLCKVHNGLMAQRILGTPSMARFTR